MRHGRKLVVEFDSLPDTDRAAADHDDWPRDRAVCASHRASSRREIIIRRTLRETRPRRYRPCGTTAPSFDCAPWAGLSSGCAGFSVRLPATLSSRRPEQVLKSWTNRRWRNFETRASEFPARRVRRISSSQNGSMLEESDGDFGDRVSPAAQCTRPIGKNALMRRRGEDRGIEFASSLHVRRRVRAPKAFRAPGRGHASAFMNAAWKVRPIPIASPVDFICVPRRMSARGNLSNGKRGNLTTT